MKPIQLQVRALATQTRDRLPVLAMMVAKHAAKGHLDEASAEPLYLEWIKGSTGATRVERGTNTVRVNTSKLRQVIRARDPKLLQRVMTMHAKLARTHVVLPLYDAMVQVCRYKNARDAMPSDNAIRAMTIKASR
jgi:hypothetical protein